MTLPTIRADLYQDRVDSQELLHVLLEYFGNGARRARNVRYHKDDLSLEVEVDDNDKITAIAPSPNFPPEKLADLRQRVKATLIDNQGTAVAQAPLFADVDVEGSFKFRKAFQLLPVTAGAPRLGGAFGDQPFLLQCLYNTSPNLVIDGMRRAKRLSFVARLLNVLIGRVTIGRKYGGYSWVLSDDPNTKPSVWRQVGYTYPAFSGKLSEYSDTSAYPAIGRVIAAEFYSQSRWISGQPVQLPDNLETSLDRAFDVTGTHGASFRLACSWFDLAETMWPECMSPSFLAYASAIESLVEKKPATRCNRCGQEMYKLTRKFKDFLNRFVPFIDKMPRERDLLYQMRSELSHGTRLFLSDLEPLSMMSVRSQEEQQLHGKLRFITATAIRNWLWSLK